jgi:hypothetical protein
MLVSSFRIATIIFLIFTLFAFAYSDFLRIENNKLLLEKVATQIALLDQQGIADNAQLDSIRDVNTLDAEIMIGDITPDGITIFASTDPELSNGDNYPINLPHNYKLNHYYHEYRLFNYGQNILLINASYRVFSINSRMNYGLYFLYPFIIMLLGIVILFDISFTSRKNKQYLKSKIDSLLAEIDKKKMTVTETDDLGLNKVAYAIQKIIDEIEKKDKQRLIKTESELNKDKEFSTVLNLVFDWQKERINLSQQRLYWIVSQVNQPIRIEQIEEIIVLIKQALQLSDIYQTLLKSGNEANLKKFIESIQNQYHMVCSGKELLNPSLNVSTYLLQIIIIFIEGQTSLSNKINAELTRTNEDYTLIISSENNRINSMIEQLLIAFNSIIVNFQFENITVDDQVVGKLLSLRFSLS